MIRPTAAGARTRYRAPGPVLHCRSGRFVRQSSCFPFSRGIPPPGPAFSLGEPGTGPSGIARGAEAGGNLPPEPRCPPLFNLDTTRRTCDTARAGAILAAASRPGCTRRTRATSRGRCSTPERRPAAAGRGSLAPGPRPAVGTQNPTIKKPSVAVEPPGRLTPSSRSTSSPRVRQVTSRRRQGQLPASVAEQTSTATVRTSSRSSSRTTGAPPRS